MARTGAAGGPSAPNTRVAMLRWTSRAWPAIPAAASPARSPSALSSSRRIDLPADFGVGLGQSLDALLDLRGRHPGVGEAEGRLAALEHEVGALDELDPADRGGIEQ